MDAFLNSLYLVTLSEIGDKTQLLALVLTLRFKKPWIVLAGIFVATVVNHALASWIGNYLSSLLDPGKLKIAISITFVLFAAWILIPDKNDDEQPSDRFGPFLTTVVLFFLAEMGDKTQLATLALAAKFQQPFLVTLGTTCGMLISDGIPVFFGEKLTRKLPLNYIRIGTAISFLAFGIINYFN